MIGVCNNVLLVEMPFWGMPIHWYLSEVDLPFLPPWFTMHCAMSCRYSSCRVSGNEVISMVMFLLLLVLLIVVARRQGPMTLSSQRRSLFLEVTVDPMGFLTRTSYLPSEMSNEPASTGNISKIGKQHHFGCSRWLKPPMQLSKNSSTKVRTLKVASHLLLAWEKLYWFWLVVSIHLNNMSQIGSFPQVSR